MSLKLAAALALAVSPLLAAPAFAGSADDAVTSFRDFCGVQGVYQDALSKADAAGWKAQPFTAQPMAGVNITDKETRAKTTSAEAMALSVTRGTAGKPGDIVNVTTCTVTAKTDFSAVAKQIGKWLAIAPATSASGATAFHYTPAATGVTAVVAGGQGAALSGGGYMILTVVDKGGGLAMIDLVTFKR